MTDTSNRPERRLNLLTGDWILVSPQRLARPWGGARSLPASAVAADHDPECHLCPGVRRAGGATNPHYEGPFVFDNDYPALTPAAASRTSMDHILVSEPQSGLCRVLCYSPHHSRTMAKMAPEEILKVVELWVEQTRDLNARSGIAAVTIFENRGEMMGASNPHPHGQVWATSSVPNELAKELARQEAWLEQWGEPLLSAYLQRELKEAARVVLENDTFVALVPYWAAWPFETMVLPRRRMSGLDQLKVREKSDLADLLGRLTQAYDALFDAPAPYSMGFHQAPSKTAISEAFTLHAHFYPPLLRAEVRKFMVGFEMLAMPQRDLTPEAAAEGLRQAARGR